MEQLRADIKKYVIDPIVPQELMTEQTKIFINPTGRFVIGGPQGDSGLTGQKNHRRYLRRHTRRHGGGAFSGKDPTKVDRSASLCGAICGEKHCGGLAWQRNARLQLAYAIGVAQPVSVLRGHLRHRRWCRMSKLAEAVVGGLRPAPRPRSSTAAGPAPPDLPSAGSIRTHRARGPRRGMGKTPTRWTLCWQLSNKIGKRKKDMGFHVLFLCL